MENEKTGWALPTEPQPEGRKPSKPPESQVEQAYRDAGGRAMQEYLPSDSVTRLSDVNYFVRSALYP